MARGRFYHDPARKHIEQYQDFSGGLNTMSANDNIRDEELVRLENIDLGERGALRRRKGLKSTPNPDAEGNPQGLFRYYRNYTPYNLLGVDGTFDGPKVKSGNKVSVSGWNAFNMPDPDASVFKVDREESQDLIVNGNFENDDEGWEFNRDTISVRTSTEQTPSGTKFLQIYRNANDPYPYHNAYQELWHDTKEGDEFYLEVHYRKAFASVAQEAPYKIQMSARVEKEDGSLTVISVARYARNNDITSTWQQMSGYLRMPKGAKRVKFGVNMYNPDPTPYTVGVFFDGFHVRREIAGSENSAVAIRATIEDTNHVRGIALRFSGVKPNTYYVYVVEYKTDGVGRGRMVVRDERFGVYPEDRGLLMTRELDDSPTDWVSRFMPFQTYDGMSEARAYVYNLSPVGTHSTVYYDNARIYEVTADVYEQLQHATDEEVAEMFPYRNGKLSSETIVETVTVVGGKFYVDGIEKEIEGGYPIQSERSIEAVNYGNNLYIASGSGLLVYNGSTISRVNPYIPDPLEELYVGTNGLVENPYVVSDEEQDVVELKRIRFSHRYGITNEFITIEVGVGKPSATAIEYKFERRNVRHKVDQWFTIRDWDTDSSATFITDVAGEYQFRISVRERGEELVLDEYLVPRYIIKPSTDPEDIPIDANTIHLCNRILVHWDRLILYGDQSKQDVIYISDLYNPAYFPVNNTLQFDNPRKEQITSIVRYRDSLVAFTPSSIQALYGTNPENYSRVMLNTDIGCISDRGAAVVKNYIVFPSYEGIALLKAVGTSESRANVDLIDGKIKNLVKNVENSVAYVKDNQYCLVYPDTKEILRYYYEWGVWTRDISDSLDIVDAYVEHGKLYALGSDGRVIVESGDYQDEGKPFTSRISTKFYDFGEPYATKKTRELQIMTDFLDYDAEIEVLVDSDDGMITKQTIPLVAGTEVYKLPIPGKCLSVRVEIKQEDSQPLSLQGLGFIFKLKRP